MSNMVLQLKNINKAFTTKMGDLTILNGINIELPAGTIAGIVAPSGTGKTTLLQIAGLMDVPDDGEVYINNLQAHGLSDKKRAHLRCHHIGYVYQQHHLLPEFTALENVTMPLLIQGIKPKKADIQASEILAEVGLAERLHHKPSELSGGEQQRVAIARAIVGTPDLFLADEPTGNLDPVTSDKVFTNMLTSLRARQGAALIVTHNHRLAKSLDKLYEIVDGNLQEKDKKKLILR